MLTSASWWPEAMANLRSLYAQHGPEAQIRAAEYAEFYEGRRAAMVFDVVASRQRRYLSRVRPMVEAYEAAGQCLAELALNGPGVIGLRAGEAETMRAVAAGLVQFATDRELDEESAARTWAVEVSDLAHAPSLDPYVGSVSGIGPALFAYLRMRCGADALKPDIRVYKALRELGFKTSRDEHALLLVSGEAAHELETSRLVLDQLLWWLEV